MTNEDAEEQVEKQVLERVEALRKVFSPLTQALQPEDEPAPVFAPLTYRREA